ncbi:MAG: family 2 glycosyl transferase [Desulfovibrio sp. S3730MH75]|nr:MAG: family 2 glycosyl transferase [Desulfovibrio sp. S3730MH75]
MALLSIVVPNYNYGRFADRFFGSIVAQTMGLNDVEIIFVDDGSDDDSLQLARKWADKIQCKRFEILTPDRCGKPGPVRNYGLERAEGRYLICLDPDDSLEPDFLSACIDTLEQNPELDLVYTDYNENSQDSSRIVNLPKFSPAHLRSQNTISPSALYRRKLWDGGVRYRDNTSYEDWDFWVQCLVVGAKFQLIPQVLYNYELHGTNFSLQAVKSDGTAKAQIVLNNPTFFSSIVYEWAGAHMRGRLHASAFQRGCIPRPTDIKALLLKMDSGEI